MSEAIKQETVPGHDYAYNTPWRIWMFPIRISGRHKKCGPYLSVCAMKTRCIIAKMAGPEGAQKWMSPSAPIGR